MTTSGSEPPPAPASDPGRHTAVAPRRRPHVDVHGNLKPLLRGRIHLFAFLVSIPAGIVLVANARTDLGVTAAAVYALSLTTLFGVSSTYHRLGRTPRTQRILRQLDHSSIYVLIAGSYTPLCLLVLPGAWRWTLLTGIWLAAAGGVAIKILRFDLAKVGSALYIAMGWAVIVTMPLLVRRMEASMLILLAAGGLVYTVGAVVLGKRRPDPWPEVFGYHEVWHTMVVAAGACHYAVILHMVRQA